MLAVKPESMYASSMNYQVGISKLNKIVCISLFYALTCLFYSQETFRNEFIFSAHDLKKSKTEGK